MRWNSLLKSGGFKRTKTGKWIDPITKKAVTRQTAFDRSAKKLGYKNYAKAKEAFASKAYKRIVSSGYTTRVVDKNTVIGYTKNGKPKYRLLPKGKAKRIDSFAKQAGINENDLELQKLFAQAWNEPNSVANKPLAQLLKYVQKINKYRSVYAGAL